MSNETCFVIMPIGDQVYDGVRVSQSELRQRYADFIKEALVRAKPGLEVVRSDEVASPGAITTDIITRIMHSEYVLADITYPNPNVFYELGLRHACRTGTIIVRDRSGPSVPFDLVDLRHIEYENTPSGIKSFATELEKYFAHRITHPGHPDNHFQLLAKITSYQFPKYGNSDQDLMEAMIAVLSMPKVLEMYSRSQAGEDVNQVELMQTILSQPEVAKKLFGSLLSRGQLSRDTQL